MSAYTAQSSGRADENPEYAGLPAIQRQILRVILEQPEHDEGGVHVGTIAKALNSRSGQNIAANVIRRLHLVFSNVNDSRLFYTVMH